MGFLKRLFGQKESSHKYKLPEGWTETKISDDNFITHIPQEQLDKWKVEKWRKDKVNDLLNDDGFHIKQDFRAGTIYFVDKVKLCEIYYELSGVSQFDILVFFDNLEEWSLPSKIKMTELEMKEIREKLIIWLSKENIKSDL
ncbi:MAG TPA: hypothetical protein VIH02_01235 [Flavobacterium sp.]